MKCNQTINKHNQTLITSIKQLIKTKTIYKTNKTKIKTNKTNLYNKLNGSSIIRCHACHLRLPFWLKTNMIFFT